MSLNFMVNNWWDRVGRLGEREGEIKMTLIRDVNSKSCCLCGPA